MTIQCTTCRYLDIESNESPCNHCGNFNMWETQEYRTVEELEKIKEKIDIECDSVDSALDVILNRIAELKGEQMTTNKEEITDAIKQIKEEAKDAANGKAEYMTMEEVFKEDCELKGESKENESKKLNTGIK